MPPCTTPQYRTIYRSTYPILPSLQVWGNSIDHSLSWVACPMMEWCGVDDTSPERAVDSMDFLQSEWSEYAFLRLTDTSINRPQPAGTRASTRSPPMTVRSQRRPNDSLVIPFRVCTSEMDMCPFFFTQLSPTHELMDPTYPNPRCEHKDPTQPTHHTPSWNADTSTVEPIFLHVLYFTTVSSKINGRECPYL